MLRTSIVCILLLFYNIDAEAGKTELIPLTSVLKNIGEDPNKLVYFLERCLALDIILLNWMEENNQQTLAKNIEKQSMALMAMRLKLFSKMPSPPTVEWSDKMVHRLGKIYTEEMLNQYALTGRKLNGFVVKDIDVCKTFVARYLSR